MVTLQEAAQQALSQLINLQPIIGNGLLNKHQLAFIDPHIDQAINALRQAIEAESVTACHQLQQPLTDWQIVETLMPLPVQGTGYFLRIARAIERAHGIGGKE